MAAASLCHKKRRLFAHFLDVITCADGDFAIGVQIAQLLHRETFNLYRSLKLKKIDTRRATPEEVEFLVSVGAVRSGTHSVTLVPYADACYFLADAQDSHISSPGSNPAKSYLARRPRLHRRKPVPWEHRRSLKPWNAESDDLKRFPVPTFDDAFRSPVSSSSSSSIDTCTTAPTLPSASLLSSLPPVVSSPYKAQLSSPWSFSLLLEACK